MKKTHKMPGGKTMEGAKHEKSESPKERLKEYGSKTGGTKSPKKKK